MSEISTDSESEISEFSDPEECFSDSSSKDSGKIGVVVLEEGRLVVA